MMTNRNYTVTTLDDGTATIETYRAVTHQQGSWRYQVRLWTATYRAEYSPHIKAWLWKCTGHGPCFSGGNIRSGGWYGEGGLHNVRLGGQDLAALYTLRENCGGIGALAEGEI